MNSTILSLSTKTILGKSPLFTFRGKDFVLANGQFYKSFASVVFGEIKNVIVRKTKFSLFGVAPLDVKATDGIYKGIRTHVFINETSNSVEINDCFFMKMDSEKSAAVVLYDSPSGTLNIKSSTFLACTDSSKNYGIIYANCEQAAIIDCCFRECYSGYVKGTLLQGFFKNSFDFNGSMITTTKAQVNESSVLFYINGSVVTRASQINATGIATNGVAAFNVENIDIKESTFNNFSCTCVIEATKGRIENCEFSLINGTNCVIKVDEVEILKSSFIEIKSPTTVNGTEAKFYNCTSDGSLTLNKDTIVADVQAPSSVEFFIYGLEPLQCLGYEVRDDCYNTTWASVKFSVAVSTWIYIGLIASATILYLSVKKKLSQPVDDSVVTEYMSGSDWGEVDGIREILANVDEEAPDVESKPEPTKETPLISDTQATIQ